MIMGILEEAGKIAGAIAAVEATEKVDPDAGLLTKAAAAIGGFEGAKALENLVEKKEDQPTDAADNSGSQDDSAAQT
jgi:hypothetical protein